ncbi:uncharacterized protein LY89DRAFT_160102 [Mollisia scopiformis]|uniref:Uncharacterized protein n=1 Tax=Mollisia scopiformis TaxID=149040 RepID=A0A194X042_MOLSC|nr:uncharacterized protein LY89DRAFT_160102 [Mollisia scopiformis]KUJ13566.1 hypothetical protein LY89DRAFT_160102 [Mollisia scopiformis]
MRFALLPLGVSFLITQVLADGASILTAMTTITNATLALNTTLNSFPSNPELAIGDIAPLLVDSVNLLDDINNGVTVATQSANLTLPETIEVAQATLNLSTAVSTTLSNLMRTKANFDKLKVITPVVLVNLKLENAASERFGAAVVAKVPPAFQAQALSLLAPIEASFNTTIAYYS